MRNATATFDDDLGRAGAARRGSSRARPAGGAGRKKSAKRARFSMNGAARYAGIGMAAAVAVGIVANALVLQQGRHPAPLFAKAVAGIPLTAASAKVPATTHSAAPAVASAPDVPTATKARRAAPRESESDAAGDAIGRLLSGETSPAVRKSGTASGRPSEARTDDAKIVSGAQRALTKLGFKVPATGTAGPATRKAIEAFEKGHHLPVNGTLDRKLVKALAAESGVKID